MTRLRGQLGCGACGHRFWPESAGVAWVFCPRCHAAHADPSSVAVDRGAHDPGAGAPSGAALARWLDARWAGPRPRFAPPPRAVDEVREGTHEGFAWIAALDPGAFNQYGGAFLWVAAYVPDGAPTTDPMARATDHLFGCGLASRIGTAWRRPPPGSNMRVNEAFVAHRVDLESLSAPLVDQAVARSMSRLLALGARPAYPLRELDDPDPLPAEPAPGPPDEDLASESVRCSGCGAPSPALSLVGDASCPYCGAAQTLPPVLAQRLAAHRRRVRAHLAAVGTELNAEQLWASTGADVELRCVHCGAPNAHRPGSTDEACAHCGSALVPPVSSLDAGVARAADAARLGVHIAREGIRRRATLERLHSHRTETLAMASALGFAALVLAGTAAVFVPMLLRPDASEQWPIFLYGVLGIGFSVALALGVLVTVLSRRRFRGAWRARFRVLGEQLRAVEVGSLGTLREFLGRWWRDTFPIDRFDETDGEGCVVTHIGGVPVAIEAQVATPPAGLTLRRGRAPTLRAVVLAATPPAREATARLHAHPARATVDALRAAGFDVELHVGGVLAKAKPETIRRLTSSPGHLSVLGPVAITVAQLAALLR